MTASFRDGAESRASRSRAPPADSVRSTQASSDPARPPAAARAISSEARVAASISMASPAPSRWGGERCGRAPFWVRSR
jgi:hypothetical protein